MNTSPTRPGITEVCWNKTFAEHHRFLWTLFVGAVSVFAGFYVPKTPYLAINLPIALFVFLNAVFIVHVQRKFSSHTPRYRKRYSRYSVYLFMFGVYVLAFSLTLAIVAETVGMLNPSLEKALQRFGDAEWIFRLTAYPGIGLGIWLGLRVSGWGQLLFKAPRDFFIRFVFARRLQATSAFQLFVFELLVVYFTYAFCWGLVYSFNIVRGQVAL